MEQRLAQLAFPRAPGESLTRWLTRVEASRPPAVTTAALPALLALHYRYRFDPAGLDASERSTLAAGAHAWLSAHATRVAAEYGGQLEPPAELRRR